MTNISDTLTALMAVDGTKCAAVVDSSSGMILGQMGTGMDLDIAAAGNTEVVRAKLATMKALGLNDTIDDILITLTTQYHIIRPLNDTPSIFIYLVLDKTRANLAMARIKTAQADMSLVL